MVEYTLDFNLVFRALSDETRRDLLSRVLAGERTITELAGKYSMSFAAVAKHLGVLTKAGLIVKRKEGREQVIVAKAEAISQITQLMNEYEKIWTNRFDRLEDILREK